MWVRVRVRMEGEAEAEGVDKGEVPCDEDLVQMFDETCAYGLE